MPTASSAQSKNNKSKIIPEISRRCLVLFTFRNTNSITKLVPKSNIPARTKSINDQFTSLVNCMATNGISNRSATIESSKRMFFGFGSILMIFNVGDLVNLRKWKYKFSVLHKRLI
jgi:hypothetical protein